MRGVRASAPARVRIANSQPYTTHGRGEAARRGRAQSSEVVKIDAALADDADFCLAERPSERIAASSPCSGQRL
jgi:hypothetical protein